MIQTARRNQTGWVADSTDSELSTGRFALADAPPAKTAAPRLDRPSVTAGIVPLDHGLYALDIGETAGLQGRVCGLQVPTVQVSAAPGGRDQRVEIIDTSRSSQGWLARDGGTVIVKSPPGGGQVLVTAYGLPAQGVAVPDVEIRRLERSRPSGAGSADMAEEPDEIRTEIVLHMERLGDRRFPGQGWIGNRGKKLRIEAFSVRPMDTLTARDIEFMALGPNRRQTPWVTEAKLCGTRGQGLPLTGFAIRLAPHIGEGFDVVYHGAFFESGIVGPNRNGELCVPPITDDPLEAINLRLIRRAASWAASHPIVSNA